MLTAADEKLFHFVNQTLANPVFDWLMPPLTDWNKYPAGIAIFLALWVALMRGESSDCSSCRSFSRAISSTAASSRNGSTVPGLAMRWTG
jgi:hypothetical protein